MTTEDRIVKLMAYRGQVVTGYTEHLIEPEQAADYAMETCCRLTISAANRRYRNASGTLAGALVTKDVYLEIIDDAIQYLKDGTTSMNRRVEKVNHYFKLAANFTPLMSGLPLPEYDKDTNTCEGVRFVRCEFHPDCMDVTYVNCEFVDCDIPTR